MQFSNTKEDGLETIIVDWLVKHNGYEQGTNADYNKEYAIDETRLFRFLADTQPDEMEKLAVFKSEQKKRTFLNRLQGELAKRGIIDVLRNGIKVYPADLIMFYLTPNENNDTAKALYAKNIFSVTRQLRYSIDAGKLALDLCIFINGLPVITFELKNQLTKQNVENAVQQYKDDRSPKEQIFSFKRCMVHFAVDDDRVKFCTKLAAQDSWFLPFDKGYNDGAGNPPNPNGLKTDYLWKEILTKDKLTRIIESYAQVVTEVDEETKKKTVKQIFPRYHQLDVVEKLIADVEANGVGNRYLIQHSAGSGKSNSIAWLAYRLMELEKDAHPIFNSILVVTDRRILDKQIRDNIKQFAQVGNVVAWAEHSGDLRKAITDGKRIIITTIEKFPYDNSKNYIDNDINISVDQTKKLAKAIREGSHFPEAENGYFSHKMVYKFLDELRQIFDWDRYEYSTLGKKDKDGEYRMLSWYAVILSQWMEGHGLNNIMRKALTFRRENPYPFYLNRYTVVTYDDSPEHKNVVFANTLEVIENIILFSISNYFLRYANMYKSIHGENSLDKNNWYEFVEYGTTNEVTIFLQRNGFSREAANYIKDHAEEYIVYADGETSEIKLKKNLLECSNNTVRTDAESIIYNIPYSNQLNL